MSTITLKKPLRIACHFKAGEFTVYLDAKDFLNQLGVAAPDRRSDLLKQTGFDFQGEVAMIGGKLSGRVNAVRCFEGQGFSVTIRGAGPSQTIPGTSGSVADLKGLNLQEVLYNSLQPIKSGLILITGETGSRKTTYLNALLEWHLQNVIGKGGSRRPHIVAIGDPVETSLKQFFGFEKLDYIFKQQRDESKKPLNLTLRRVDFTARTISIDVPDVKTALMLDALRETPSVVVVSELRTDADFCAALDFAATGHTIFATAHSSSLVDAFGKLMQTTDVKTANDRAALVQCLQGVVHVARIGDLFVPTLWRATPAGKQSFISEGRASIIQGPRGQDPERGCLGRHSMLNRVIGSHAQHLKEAMALDLAGR